MKTLIALLAILIQVSLHSQTVPVSKRFLGEEYRLFLPGREAIGPLFKASTDRTDQIFTINLDEVNNVYIIESQAIKFVCHPKKNSAELYFDNQYEGEYLICFWDCYSYFVVTMPSSNTTYYFYRIYSLDKAW